jgi:hypothetical protein
MAGQEHTEPWWERPAKVPGEPHYEPEREHLRAELARARRADLASEAAREARGWGAAGRSPGDTGASHRVAA